MKVQLFVPVAILASVALLAVMKVRKKEHYKGDKQNRFQDIKLRVTYDVLSEYQNDKAETQIALEKAETAQKALEEEMNMVRTKSEKAKGDSDVCQGGQKSATDELASLETEFTNIKAETEKEKSSWTTEEATLQEQLKQRSTVCNFLKPGSQTGSKLCGDAEAPKPEKPKPEPPKQEEPKAEAPKPEVPKAEAPKPEEPKAEAPKPEEPKAEAPKAEAPKPEEPKAEDPKPEKPKAEAPKPEEPKAEAPKPEAPKPEEPKAEAPKPEEPKAEAPKKR